MPTTTHPTEVLNAAFVRLRELLALLPSAQDDADRLALLEAISDAAGFAAQDYRLAIDATPRRPIGYDEPTDAEIAELRAECAAAATHDDSDIPF
jgi:2-oxo-4-hydroxy-4-carboxy--5-ureidoimidazoline (OHCU) decarboxylase